MNDYEHHHSHQETKAVLNRLSRAQGHLDAVRRMVERGEDCAEVLVQLSAVISALNGTGRAILKDHISHCIVDAVEAGDEEAIQALNDAIQPYRLHGAAAALTAAGKRIIMVLVGKGESGMISGIVYTSNSGCTA